MSHSILYSFRRCPYAMRARLAIFSAQIEYEHREVLLRDKPSTLLELSPKGTVPVLLTGSGKLIEESIEREINPTLKKDSGSLELVDVDGNRVLVRMGGNCASCVKSPITLKHYVESKLRELVAPEIVVEEVQ